MANEIEKVYVQTYEQILRQIAQQSESRLRPFVMERASGGENHNWERLSSAEAIVKNGRTATVDAEGGQEYSRRVSVAQTKHISNYTEQEDVVQMIVDPNSNMAMSQGMAMKRAYDDEIIAAATGTALDGDGAAVAFPAAQTVGDGTAPISFDLVTEVTEKFLDNDIDEDEAKCFVVGPKQIRKLLQLTEVTSADYVELKALMSGQVRYWMGYTWIPSTRLLIPAADEITCFAMTKRALGLQVNKDIWARVTEDPTQSFAWLIYAASTFGAVRVEDEHIVQVHVADTL